MRGRPTPRLHILSDGGNLVCGAQRHLKFEEFPQRKDLWLVCRRCLKTLGLPRPINEWVVVKETLPPGHHFEQTQRYHIGDVRKQPICGLKIFKVEVVQMRGSRDAARVCRRCLLTEDPWQHTAPEPKPPRAVRPLPAPIKLSQARYCTAQTGGFKRPIHLCGPDDLVPLCGSGLARPEHVPDAVVKGPDLEALVCVKCTRVLEAIGVP
jgi:hypothetical protein